MPVLPFFNITSALLLFTPGPVPLPTINKGSVPTHEVVGEATMGLFHLPNEVESQELAVTDSPNAILYSAAAIELFPIAVEENPLAVVNRPIAVELFPLAVVFDPIAVE